MSLLLPGEFRSHRSTTAPTSHRASAAPSCAATKAATGSCSKTRPPSRHSSHSFKHHRAGRPEQAAAAVRDIRGAAAPGAWPRWAGPVQAEGLASAHPIGGEARPPPAGPHATRHAKLGRLTRQAARSAQPSSSLPIVQLAVTASMAARQAVIRDQGNKTPGRTRMPANCRNAHTRSSRHT